LSSVITYHWIFNKSNTTGTISGAGTAYHSGPSEFTHGFFWRSYCIIFCILCIVSWTIVCLFVIFLVSRRVWKYQNA